MGKKDFEVSDYLNVSTSFCFENSSTGFNSLQRDIFGTSTLCMSQSGVHLIENGLNGVQKAGTSSRCPF